MQADLMVRDMPSGFGKRLRELREAKGLSAYRLSQLVGVSRAAISRMEGGQAGPSWEMAVRIALALGVSLDDLATDDIQLPEVDEAKPVGRPRKVETPSKRKRRKDSR